MQVALAESVSNLVASGAAVLAQTVVVAVVAMAVAAAVAEMAITFRAVAAAVVL